jgi:hypothetical protein
VPAHLCALRTARLSSPRRQVAFAPGVKEKDHGGNVSVWGLVTQVHIPPPTPTLSCSFSLSLAGRKQFCDAALDPGEHKALDATSGLTHIDPVSQDAESGARANAVSSFRTP